MTAAAKNRPLSDFNVEIEVYSGPYEWLLALILKEELEVFEVPLREIVDLYLRSRPADELALERDTDFAGSAAALILLKSRALFPAVDEAGREDKEPELSPEQLAERLSMYLKVKRGAEHLRECFAQNAGFHPSGHALRPRPGRMRVDRRRLELAARRAFSRLEEPSVSHLGPITVTIQELAAVIRTSLSRGPLSYEELVRGMDRTRSALAFAAAVTLASEGDIVLSQSEPFGPLTLIPA